MTFFGGTTGLVVISQPPQPVLVGVGDHFLLLRDESAYHFQDRLQILVPDVIVRHGEGPPLVLVL
jgi:hypothetical protein